jgi:hypothetical protein
MSKVLLTYDQSDETILLSVHLLDLYLSKQNTPIKSNDFDLLGVVAILVASKFLETFHFTLKDLMNKVVKNSFSFSQIIQKEKHFLQVIEFNLHHPTMNSISNILFEILELPPYFKKKIMKYCLIFQKMIVFSHDLITEFSNVELTGFSLILSLKLLENSKIQFCSKQLVSEVIELLDLSKENILLNFNFVRYFIKNFKKSYEFSYLNDTM